MVKTELRSSGSARRVCAETVPEPSRGFHFEDEEAADPLDYH